MIKKGIFLIVILCFITFFLLGCKDKASNKKNLIFATGSTSGTYYPYGEAIAQIFNTNINGIKIAIRSSGASRENIKLLDQGKADFAIVQNDVMDYAINGIELFSGERITSFLTIATLYPEVVQVIVAKNSKIASISDMKGKSISVGDPGSGVEANAKQLLEAYGLTFSDMTVRRLSFRDSAIALRDRQIEAFFATSGVPNEAIKEITAAKGVELLSIDNAVMQKLIEKYNFFVPFVVPKETYNGMVRDVMTVAVKATLIASVNMPEKTVYEFTKTLFNKQTELAQIHYKGNELSLANAVLGVSVPLHPGAEKYFKEVGVLK